MLADVLNRVHVMVVPGLDCRDDRRHESSGDGCVLELVAARADRDVEAVELAIVQQPDASSVRVVAAVKAKLKEIEADHPGLRFEVAYDNSTFVGFLMENMVEELVIAVLLTGLVVLLFLGNMRGTLISVITIPISLGMALLAMVPFGMTLNSSTLIGLLLSIGRLVDDIARHAEQGSTIAIRASAGDGTIALRVGTTSDLDEPAAGARVGANDDRRPFEEVDAEHARLEGEGDLTLASWRRAHEWCWTTYPEHDRGFSPSVSAPRSR